MVGRSKRLTAKEVIEVVSEDDDIVCLDGPTKESRKSRTVRNLKPKVPDKREPEKSHEEEDNVFAGIDIEGVPEEEKRQIKEALLASTKDQVEHVSLDITEEESIENNTSNSREVYNEISDVDVDGSDSEGNKTVQEQPTLDDDETQPPSDTDIDGDEIGLNLDQSTLGDSRDDIFETDSTIREDADSTLKEEDIYKVEIEDVTINKKRKKALRTSSPLPQHKYSSQEDLTGNESDTIIGSKVHGQTDSKVQLNETSDSQGFELDLQRDFEKDQGSIVGQSSSFEDRSNMSQNQSNLCQGQPDSSQELKDSHKIGHTVSKETCDSNIQEKGVSQKSTSQRSLDSAQDASKSSGSQKSAGQTTRSNSQDSKIGIENFPLKRHYRAVKKEFQNVRHDKYFGDTADIEASAKAIYQLFETFRRKLYEAQRRCREKVPWPDPVKTGQHQGRTIDVKKRGQDSICLDLSDDDDSHKQERKLESSTGRQRNARDEGGNDSDGLPELVIESNNDGEPLTRGRLTRRGLHTKHADNDIMSADTQPYDYDNDDDDFVPNLRNRLRRQPRACTNKDSHSENTCLTDDVTEKENEKRPRGRPGRKLGLITETFHKKVLAEETQQEDVDLQEAIRRSKIDSQISLPETQITDDDFDWLSVKQQNGKEEFENQIHRAKLKGYTIPKRGQVHSKTHKKIVNSEQANNEKPGARNEEASVEQTTERQKKEPREVNENAAHLRGRKRKAKKQMGVTLVADTQDSESEEVESSKFSGKRKRNCFKLDDSDTEEESIAESQDMDRPFGNSQSEKPSNKDNCDRDTENMNKSKSEGFISSVVNKVKSLVTPVKKKEPTNESGEGSKSPIISKKKLNSQSKSLPSKACDRNETDYETEAFNVYKSHSAEKKAKTVQAEARKGRVQISFDESDLIEETGIPEQVKNIDKNSLIEENGIPEGVKRFVSRPSSKDSNASDNLSTTSSQMSTNILDEKGDIYSTQYCEIRTRRGKDAKPKDYQKQKENNKEELEEVLMLDSDDEVPVLKESKKTYSVKRKAAVVKGFRVAEKRVNQQAPSKECIIQYFDKTPKEGDKNDPIDLDPDIKEQGHDQTKKHMNGQLSSDAVGEFRDHLSTSTRSRDVSRKKVTVTLPVISVIDGESDHEVDVDHGSFEYNENHSKGNLQNTARRVKRQQNTDTIQHLDIGSENPPVMLNNANKASTSSSDTLEQYVSGNRPKTRHTEINTNLYEHRQVNKRQRKVSETITSGEYEARVSGVRTRGAGVKAEQDVSGEDWGHVKGSLRKRPGQHDSDEDENPIQVKKKIEMVECPICNKQFPSNIIEQHADICLGGSPGETEPHGKMTAEEYIQHLAEEHPELSRDEIFEQLHHHQHHHHHHHDHVGGMHGHMAHLHETDDEDDEVGHIIQNDVIVEDVAKDIRCSPGEEGEVQACYICDAQIPKGKPYEMHINRCLKLAAQQQAEVDKKGYNRVFTEPEEDEVQIRHLRGRQVNQVDRSSTPRSRHQAEGSPAHHGNLNLELNSQSPASHLGGNIRVVTIQSPQQYDQGDHGSEQGAAKRVMRRGNRNKAAFNDDGSGGSSR